MESEQRQAEDVSHPGELLRDCVIPALQVSVSQIARDLCVARQTLHRILAGDAAISPDMAVRLEKLCGVPWSFWLERQHRHDMARIVAQNRELLPRIPSRALPESVIQQIGALNGK